MYTLFALTAPRIPPETPELRLQEDMVWLVSLAKALAILSPKFESLGLISGDTQSWIDAKISEYENTDAGLPESLISEFDRISVSNRVSLLRDPVAFADLTLQNIVAMRADGYDGNRISAATTGQRIDGSLTRVDYDTPGDLGTLAIELPMRDKDDLWFSAADTMRELLDIVLHHVPKVTWLCAYPTMYVGRQKSLFRDRRNFGWMGFTANPLAELGPLYKIAAASGGTFLQLKPTMMTLHAIDVELCNEAEAFLSDKELLPLL